MFLEYQNCHATEWLEFSGYKFPNIFLFVDAAIFNIGRVIALSHLSVRPSVPYPAEIRNELAGNEMKRAQIGMDWYDTFRSAPFRLKLNVIGMVGWDTYRIRKDRIAGGTFGTYIFHSF